MRNVGLIFGLALAFSASAQQTSDSCQPVGGATLYQRWTLDSATLKAMSSYDQLCASWTAQNENQRPPFSGFLKNQVFGDLSISVDVFSAPASKDNGVDVTVQSEKQPEVSGVIKIALDRRSPMTRDQYIKLLVVADRLNSDTNFSKKIAEYNRVNQGFNTPVPNIEFGDKFSFKLISGIRLNINAKADEIVEGLSQGLDTYNSMVESIMSGIVQIKSLGYDIKLFCNNDEATGATLAKYKVALTSAQQNCSPTFSTLVEALRDEQVGETLKRHGVQVLIVDQQMKGPDWRSAVWIKANSPTEVVKAFLKSI